MEVVQVNYFNVCFYLLFNEENKYLVEYLDSFLDGKIFLKDIEDWAKTHSIPYRMKFRYKREYPIRANIWNFYTYIRFLLRY